MGFPFFWLCARVCNMSLLCLTCRIVALAVCLGLASAACAVGGQDVHGPADCGGAMAPADRIHCENVQQDAADKALGRILGVLMESLDADARRMLDEAQHGWLAYREANFGIFSAAASARGQEGLAEQVRAMRLMTEARVRELEDLYRLLRDAELFAAADQGAPGEVAGAQGPQGADARDGAATAAAGGGDADPAQNHAVTPSDAGDGVHGAAEAGAIEAGAIEAVAAAPADKGEAEPSTAVPDAVVESEAALDELVGEHALRLQWLSAEPQGRVVVRRHGGALLLTGRQGGDGAQVVLDGYVARVGRDSFSFHGTLTTHVGFVNGGKPCVRKGYMVFARKGGRAFWRLQSITNPCCGVIDYVDVSVGRPAAD